jgi:hypothetical protein
MNIVNSMYNISYNGAVQSNSNKIPDSPTSLVYIANSATANSVVISCFL